MEWYEFDPRSSLVLPLIAQTLLCLCFFSRDTCRTFLHQPPQPTQDKFQLQTQQAALASALLLQVRNPQRTPATKTSHSFTSPAPSLHLLTPRTGAQYLGFQYFGATSTALLLQRGRGFPSPAVHPPAAPAPRWYVTPQHPAKPLSVRGNAELWGTLSAHCKKVISDFRSRGK